MSRARPSTRGLRNGNRLCQLKDSPDAVITSCLRQYLHAPSDFFISQQPRRDHEALMLKDRISRSLLEGEFKYLYLGAGLIYSLCTGVSRTVSVSEVFLQSLGLFRGHALQKVRDERWSSLICLLSATAQQLPTVVHSLDPATLDDIRTLLHFMATKLATSGPSFDNERFYFIYPDAN
ncbi:hypothetical protein TWF696_003661 [Orbilia brochopaga]|uniref:Uncharacterized protein n=1 Tax=Orbilia brochopaga TaxID=3140254 RepID=A0AAV9V5G5_9PEZI